MTRISQASSRPGAARLMAWLAYVSLMFFPRVLLAKVIIDVRSQANLVASAQCDRPGTHCVVQGSLRDELGEPIANQTVRGAFETVAPHTANGTVQFKPCSRNLERLDALGLAPEATNTSATGDFCLQIDATESVGGLPFRVIYDGSEHTDAESLHVELASRGAATDIEWLNSRKRIGIDTSGVLIELSLQADNTPVVHQQVTLMLVDEQLGQSKSELFRIAETTDEAGIARYRISGRIFGSVGAARLEALFNGNTDLSAARGNWPIFRTCSVYIQPGTYSHKLALGEHETLSVLLSTACATPLRGIVEFSRLGQLEHRAPIEGNSAGWAITAGLFASGPITIDAKYIPPSEGWTSTSDAHFDLLVTPASEKEAIFWLIAASALTAWLVVRWGHGVRRPFSRLEHQGDPATLSSIDRVPPESGKSGWYGVIIDAHAGHPISSAHVRIERPGFAHPEIGCSARSSATGHFELPPLENRDLSRLVVEADLYNSGKWPLPPEGRLTIRLQTNRRAILHTFVTWFKNSMNWEAKRGEPTPAQVTDRDIVPEHSVETIAWAKKVEEAAFGPNEPDNGAHALLSGTVPSPGTRRAR